MFSGTITALHNFWESVKDHKTTISVSTGGLVLVAAVAFYILF